MAKLEYDSTGRLLFTEEMRKEYTILIPQMLPVHFGLFAKIAYCSIIDPDLRRNIDDELDPAAYGATKDFVWGGIGVTFNF